MLNRLKAILIDFIQQADLLLLGLCSAATLYGLVLIFSATRYMTPEKGMRRMIIQSAALLLGVGVYIFISMVDLEMIMKKWKWILAFNVVFISLLVTPLGIGAKETGVQTCALPISDWPGGGGEDNICAAPGQADRVASGGKA